MLRVCIQASIMILDLKRTACFFHLSHVTDSCFTSLVNQGQKVSETRLLRTGACFSTIIENIIITIQGYDALSIN